MKLSKDQISEIKRRVKIMDVVRPVVQMRRASNEYTGLCPFHNETTPSFFVNPRKNVFKCFGCGAQGDAIEFVKKIENTDFTGAMERLAGLYGVVEGVEQTKSSYTKTQPSKKDDQAEQNRIQRQKAKGKEIYKKAMPAQGTLVEDYLDYRGIDLNKLPEGTLRQIRFSNEQPYWVNDGGGYQCVGHFPAMICPMQTASGEIVGSHITYLKEDGRGKLQIPIPGKPGKFYASKKVRGLSKGCSIRLAKEGRVMVVAEGVENALSAMMIWPNVPAWAAYSLTNLAGNADKSISATPNPQKPGTYLPSIYPDFKNPGWVPPKVCRRLYILAERDGDHVSTQCLIQRAARRFAQAYGIDVRLVWSAEGMDHNDMLLEGRK